MKDRSAHGGGGSPEAPRTEATAAQGEEQGEPEAEMEEMERWSMGPRGGWWTFVLFFLFVSCPVWG